MSDEKKPEHKNLWEALLAAKQEMAPVTKNATNPHFRSKFADLAHIMDIVEPVLAKHGLLIMHVTEADSTAGNDGVRVAGNKLGTVLALAPTGEVQTSDIWLQPSKPNDPQALGACITYLRRYSVLAMLGIAPEDDDGNEASGRVTTGPKAATSQVAPSATRATAPASSPTSPQLSAAHSSAPSTTSTTAGIKSVPSTRAKPANPNADLIGQAQAIGKRKFKSDEARRAWLAKEFNGATSLAALDRAALTVVIRKANELPDLPDVKVA